MASYMPDRPRIESYRIVLNCVCAQAEIVVTMASDLYMDAQCPHCKRIYRTILNFQIDHPDQETRMTQMAIAPLVVRACQANGQESWQPETTAYWVIWQSQNLRPYDARQFATYEDASEALQEVREQYS